MKTTALYTEVYNKILEGIQSGEFPENAPLPAERFLCDKYHVSRSTLRTALMLLNKEGIVYTLAGAGTFIKPTYFVQPLKSFYSFADTLKEKGIEIQNDIVSYNLIAADQELTRTVKCREGSIFHKIVRLRSARGCPLMTEASYLPQSRFSHIELKEFVSDSMYEFLKRTYDFSPEKAVENFRPVIPLPYEKEMLQIYGNVPCMLLERFTYEKDGSGGLELAEYTRSVIRGDKFMFQVELE